MVKVVVLLAGLAAAGSAGADGPPLTADTIFARTRDAASATCRARIEYVIVVTAVVNGRPKQNHFRATYLGDGYLRVANFSNEEQQSPYVPHGVNILVTLGLGVGNVRAGDGYQTGGLPGLSRALTNLIDHDGPPPLLLGVPLLEPGYAFGLRRHPSGAVGVVPQSAPSPGLRTIGTATASYREYDVELVAIEAEADGRAYHLRLTPRREPQRNRLREMWVDVSTFTPLRVITAGNFTAGPPTRARWLTTFHRVRNCTLIDTETALEPLDYGRSNVYDRTSIVFDVISDPDAYRTPVLTFRRPPAGDELVEPDE